MNVLKFEWSKREMSIVAVATTDNRTVNCFKPICNMHAPSIVVDVQLIISPTIYFTFHASTYFACVHCNHRRRCLCLRRHRWSNKSEAHVYLLPIRFVLLLAKDGSHGANCATKSGADAQKRERFRDNTDAAFRYRSCTQLKMVKQIRWTTKFIAYRTTVFSMLWSLLFSFNWWFRSIKPEIQGCSCLVEKSIEVSLKHSL